MEAAQQGDAPSYQNLLVEIDVWLRRYYRRRLPDAIVEDAAQDALLAVHSRRHTYEAGRPFKPWLSAIARYKWIDRLRSMARDPVSSECGGEGDEGAVADHGASVASAILLSDLFAYLKPAQAHVIRLAKLGGLTIEEASEQSGQSPSLVKVNIHRGLAKLSQLMENDMLQMTRVS